MNIPIEHLIEALGAAILALIAWLLKRSITENDVKMKDLKDSAEKRDIKLEQMRSDMVNNYVTKADMTLLREENQRGFAGIATQLDTNKDLILALVKRDAKG